MNNPILNSGNEIVQLTRAEYEKMMKFIEFSEAEQEALKGNSQEDMIKHFADWKASKDDKFKEAYENNKQGKTIKDCYQYIVEQARTSNQNMMDSKSVFMMVENYFLDDNIKKKEEPKYTPSTQSITTDKKRAEEWEIQNKKRIEDWERENLPKREKWEIKHKQIVDEWKSDMFADPNNPPAEVTETNPYAPDKNPHLNATNPFLPKDKKDEDKENNEKTSEDNDPEEEIEETPNE